MQQADVAALWLLEALVLTLPQSLLQAYVVVSTDVGIMSPGTPGLRPAALHSLVVSVLGGSVVQRI